MKDQAFARARRQSLGDIFLFPTIIAAVSCAGLISALVGDDIWDALSWMTLSVPVAVVYTAYCYDNINLDAVSVLGFTNTALAERINRIPIGGDTLTGPPGKLYLDSIKSCIDNSLNQIYLTQVQSPTADITLGVGDVVVLASADGTVVFTPSPENTVV